MTAGGGGNRWDTCWHGVIDGYHVGIDSGAQLYGGGKGMCETDGMYDIDIQVLDRSSRPIGGRYYYGCDDLFIQNVSGHFVTFTNGMKVDIFAITQEQAWAQAIVSCPPNIGAGSITRTSANCWQGVVNGYDVFVWAGHMAGHMPMGNTGSFCEQPGFAYIEAWAPDSMPPAKEWVPPNNWHQVYQEWFYPQRCTLHFVGARGSTLTFEDLDNINPFVVDIAPHLPTPLTPTPPTP